MFAPGALLADRYRVVRFIARGGMGEVYEAEDLTLHMSVALKSIAPEAAADTKMILRLKREVLLARKVTHPNVCRLHDLGVHTTESGTVAFLTMDLLRGETLTAHIALEERFTTEEALPIAIDMASALDAAHRAGVIHRDFKSRNVILEERGEGMAPKAVVMDFGIALASSDEARQTPGPLDTGEGHFLGTPAYMAPEQVSGATATPATDVYAFGLVLYEMVTGSLPFVAERALEVITMRLTHDPTPPRERVPSLDPRWNDVILRCLAREPAARFGSAKEAVDALVAPPVFWTRRRLWLGAALIAGALAVGGAVLLARARKGEVVVRPFAPAVQAVEPVPADAPKRRPVLAVLAMKNTAGPSSGSDLGWLSTALPDMLRSELQADDALRIVPGDRVDRATRDLGLDPIDPSPGMLGRVRDNLGADYVITGVFTAGDGDALRVAVTLDDARSGASIVTLVSDGARGRLLDLVQSLGDSIRKKLGLRDPSAAEVTAARAASPGTPDVARAYAEGEARLPTDLPGALAAFQRAVDLDPAFPLAHAGLARAASALGDDATALEQSKKALETSRGLSREQQLAVEASYRAIGKQWGRAVEIWRTLFGFAPDNIEYGLHYAQALWAAGRPNEAFPVIDALRALPPPERDDPRIDYYESIAASKISDFRRMQSAGRAAAEKAERIGAWEIAGRGHHQIAEAHAYLHEEDAALPEWEKAREEFAKVDDKQGEADSIKGLADVYVDSGDPGRALPMMEKSLALTRAIGARYKIANGVQDVGNVRYALGDSAGARALFDEARGLYEAIHDREGVGNALGNKARTLWDDGDLAGARAMAADARVRLQEVDARDSVTSTTIDLGDMALAAGDLARAAAEVAQGEALAKGLGIAYHATHCKVVRAEIARETGDLPAAKRLATEARAEFLDARAGSEAMAVELLLARLALDEGRPADAEALASEVSARAHATSERPLEATALGLLASALAAQKKNEEAASAIERATAVGATQVEVRIDVAIGRASVLAASPAGVAAAQKILADARALAERSGFVARSFDVRLASGRIARGSDSRVQLMGVAADASAKGFRRAAQAAEAGARLVVSSELGAPAQTATP
jgi:tetratricopeptide (TPR) repeat protein